MPNGMKTKGAKWRVAKPCEKNDRSGKYAFLFVLETCASFIMGDVSDHTVVVDPSYVPVALRDQTGLGGLGLTQAQRFESRPQVCLPSGNRVTMVGLYGNLRYRIGWRRWR